MILTRYVVGHSILAIANYVISNFENFNMNIQYLDYLKLRPNILMLYKKLHLP